MLFFQFRKTHGGKKNIWNSFYLLGEKNEIKNIDNYSWRV